MNTQPVIAITMGDPGGIGPEVLVKAIQDKSVQSLCKPVIVGDFEIIKEAARLTGCALTFEKADAWQQVSKAVPVIEPVLPGTFEKCAPGKEAGYAVYAYIKKAVSLALEGQVNAIVTAPISKASLKMAALPWPGHTEMLAELTQTRDYAMMLVGGPLRVILVTIHMALREVPNRISKALVLKTIRLAQKAALMLDLHNPRIGVAGLNPHAGESGLFGDEEGQSIVPAVEEARAEGISVTGPYPPDVIFHLAFHGKLDIVCAMYHDQGLIPLKMTAFEQGVNITVGLPIIRTSPDHGTAFDIAWRNQANPSSMIQAIKLAANLKTR
ncbi:MAG TPA: 4-hydroxythreonine-4-phosphate dehydrogenase PdxA [Thermodesulfovibrionia bacterium]|nr:4-hydroxythreonine-4-phosphate dehydrogenase PdxA [Thermodesulfovibrionia bacterium]